VGVDECDNSVGDKLDVSVLLIWNRGKGKERIDVPRRSDRTSNFFSSDKNGFTLIFNWAQINFFLVGPEDSIFRWSYTLAQSRHTINVTHNMTVIMLCDMETVENDSGDSGNSVERVVALTQHRHNLINHI
jgi:hypothetical protein